ncbi:unnamed protein product [Phaeothamnion confervicola]
MGMEDILWIALGLHRAGVRTARRRSFEWRCSAFPFPTCPRMAEWWAPTPPRPCWCGRTSLGSTWTTFWCVVRANVRISDILTGSQKCTRKCPAAAECRCMATLSWLTGALRLKRPLPVAELEAALRTAVPSCSAVVEVEGGGPHRARLQRRFCAAGPSVLRSRRLPGRNMMTGTVRSSGAPATRFSTGWRRLFPTFSGCKARRWRRANFVSKPSERETHSREVAAPMHHGRGQERKRASFAQ